MSEVQKLIEGLEKLTETKNVLKEESTNRFIQLYKKCAEFKKPILK